MLATGLLRAAETRLHDDLKQCIEIDDLTRSFDVRTALEALAAYSRVAALLASIRESNMEKRDRLLPDVQMELVAEAIDRALEGP